MSLANILYSLPVGTIFYHNHTYWRILKSTEIEFIYVCFLWRNEKNCQVFKRDKRYDTKWIPGIKIL